MRRIHKSLRNAGCFIALAALVVAGCSKPQTNRGKQVYEEYCARCHGADGKGGSGGVSLAGRSVWSKNSDRLLRTLLYGASGTGHPDSYGAIRSMPPIPYTDADVAAVAEYTWQLVNAGSISVSEQDVRNARLPTRSSGLQQPDTVATTTR